MNSNNQQLESFCLVLSSILSQDNDTRKQAEAQFNSLPKDTVVQLCLQVMSAAVEDKVKSISCTMLKMVLRKNLKLNEISPDVLGILKTYMPQIVVSTTNAALRKSCIAAFTSLVEHFMVDGDNKWPEVISLVGNWLSSKDLVLMENALNVIIYYPGIFGNQLDQSLPQLVSVFDGFLQSYQTNPKMVCTTVECVTMLAEECENKQECDTISSLVPTLLKIIKPMTSGDEGCEFMNHFTCLLECHTRIFKNYVVDVVHILLEVLYTPTSDEKLTTDIYEAVVTYVEKIPSAIKKQAASYIQKIVDFAFNLLAKIDEEIYKDWFNDFDDDNDDNLGDAPYFGETSLDRLACSLKGKVILPLVLANIKQFLSTQNWKYHDAAIVALGAVAEGCHKQMKPLLPQIVSTLLPFFQSDNAKVVYSLINTFGQLATDFPGLFHNKFHAQVFPMLFTIAQNHSVIKVQSQAIYAFVNIMDGCNEDLMEKYMQTILTILADVLSKAIKLVNVDGVFLLLNAVTNSLIHACEKLEQKIEPYVDSFIPNLFSIIEGIHSIPKLQKTFGQVLDCIVSLEVAISEEKSAKYVPNTLKSLELFQNLCANSEKKEELEITYFSVMAKLADVSAHHLTTILPNLVPVILQKLSADVDSFSSNIEAFSSEIGASYVKDDHITDKCLLCEILNNLASNLKASFAPYVQSCLQVIVQLMQKLHATEYYSSLILPLPAFLACLVHNNEMNLALGYWNESIKGLLLNFMKNIEDTDNWDNTLETLTDCIENLGVASLQQPELQILGSLLNEGVKRCLVLNEEVLSSKLIKGDAMDEDLLDDVDADDMYMIDMTLRTIQECTHDIFKVFTNDSILIVQPMYASVVDCSSKDNETMFLRFAFCVFDDILEFAPNVALKCLNDFLPKMFTHLQSNDPDMRQVTVFGFGLIAQVGIKQCDDYLLKTIPIINKFMREEDSMSIENSTATANMIATYGRYIKYAPHLFANPLQELSSWVQFLPVYDDEVEFILQYLCEIIENHSNAVFNSNEEHNLKMIDAVVSMTLECTNEDVNLKAVNTIMFLERHFPQHIENCMSNLDDVQKATFMKIAAKVRGN